MANPRTARSPSRILRGSETIPEQLLWSWLRNRQLNGVKFRRQQQIGPYVVDFVSFERKFIIELDGGQHATASDRDKDAIRTSWLESQGFRVLRFWNNGVMSNMDGVVTHIREALK